MGDLMERMMLDDIDQVIYREHIDRYKFISPFLQGRVIDIACGIGYGASEIIASNAVTSVACHDIDDEAIEIASHQFLQNDVSFSFGDITSLAYENDSFDSAISFETLEHLDKPERAVSEISRVLVDDGVWLGSVPNEKFDDKCTEVYGPNPYHVTRFDQSSLRDILSPKFKYIKIFSNELLLFSAFQSIDETKSSSVISNNENVFGSLMFFATNSAARMGVLEAQLNSFTRIMSLVEYDEIRVKPIREAFNNVQEMVAERDSVIEFNDEIIKDFRAREKSIRFGFSNLFKLLCEKIKEKLSLDR